MIRGSRWLPVLLLCGAIGCGRSSRSNPGAEASAGEGAEGIGGGPSSTGGTGGVDHSSFELQGAPLYTRVQRLTISQWERAVRDILRIEPPEPLSSGFQPPSPAGTDFTNNERLLHVDRLIAADFERGSEAAALLATSTPDALTRLGAGTEAGDFVTELGRRAFRRPLTPEQQERYESVFALGEELYGEGFANGAALVIRALLQSPHFLYRSELGEEGEPLDGYEAASKLSFWLLGTTPSNDLLDAAAAGELDSADGLEQVARQMLAEPSALDVMRDFHGQAYHLDRYVTTEKIGVPEFTPALRAELTEASHLFFDLVLQRDQGLRELLTSERAFVGPALAPLYGLPAPEKMAEQALDPARAGFFTQLPFLLAFSANYEPGTIYRGTLLNEVVLCNTLDPPLGPIPSLGPPVPNRTNRERISELTAECGDCHRAFINPLGFAFEAFDGMGRQRERDQGKPIDTSGSYPFASGERAFRDAKELMQIIADAPQAHFCYARKLSSYSLQRDIVESDRPMLESLADVSREQSLKEVIVRLVRDPAFRLRAKVSL